MLEPGTSIQFVKGIGPRWAEALAAKGIRTVDDLLFYLPFRYEDRVNPRRIAELQPGEMASVIAEVRNSGLFQTQRMPLFQLVVGDPGMPAAPIFGVGGVDRSRTLKCLWFHGAYLKDKFKPGQLVALYGKVELSQTGSLQIIQPQIEVLNDPTEKSADADANHAIANSLEIGHIVPIYETAANGKLTSRWFRRIIRTVLENSPPQMPDLIPQAIPGVVIDDAGLVQGYRIVNDPRVEGRTRIAAFGIADLFKGMASAIGK